MPSQEKKEKVKQIKKWFAGTDALLVLHYKGLTVSEATELRTTISGQGADMRVLKNTLTRIALADTEHAGLVPLIDGPIAVVFVKEDPASLARVIRDFTRGRKDLYFQGGMLGSRVLDGKQVDTFAMLPSREVLLAQAIGQAAAPLSGMVGVAAGLIRKMLTLFKAVAEKKGPEPGAAATTEAPPAAEEKAEEPPAEEPQAAEEAVEAEAAETAAEEAAAVTETEEEKPAEPEAAAPDEEPASEAGDQEKSEEPAQGDDE